MPVRDPGALARALGDLLHDEARRASLAVAARAAVDAYDWRTVTAQIVAVYETVTAAVAPSVHVEVDADLEVLAALLDDGEQEDDAGRVVTTLRRWIAERPRRERVP